MYTILLYDSDLNRLHSLKNATNISPRKRLNSAGKCNFSYPPNDTSALSDIALLHHAVVYRGNEKKFSGVIRSRNLSGNEYIFELEGHESLLLQYKTPRRWEGWNNLDLADVVKDALNKFCLHRLSTKEQWDAVYESHQVQTDLEEDAVVIEYELHPDYTPEKEIMRPKKYGYIIVRIDLGENALSTGRIARWTEVVGDTERITIQSRSADTEAALDAAVWTEEMTAVHVGEVEENEVSGVMLAGNGQWLDVKVNLYADDQETVHKDESGNIIGYGYTPALQGLEIIWREPGDIVAGYIPSKTNLIVEGYEFERENHLRVLTDICEQYGAEFRVYLDEDNRQIVLDLGQEVNGDWIPTFGQDKSDDVILTHGKDTKITVLRDESANMANVLHCWGAGHGTSQLYVKLVDQESIDCYKKEVHDDFERTEITSLLELGYEGQKELDKRSHPVVTFEVEAYKDNIEPVGLGDVVTVVHPKSGLIIRARILDEQRRYTKDGERRTFGLDDFIENPIERVLGRPKTARKIKSIPKPPTEVSANGAYGLVVVSWRGYATSFAVRFREIESEIWQITEVKDAREFIHTGGLEPGSQWEYQVASIIGNKISGWSHSVGAVVAKLPVEDIEYEVPDPPTELSVNEESFLSKDGNVVLVARLRWTESTTEGIVGYLIERKSADGDWEQIALIGAGADIYDDTSGLKINVEYSWRIKTLGEAGAHYSGPSSTVTKILVGNVEVPDSPTTVTYHMDSDGNLKIRWQYLDDATIKHYVVEVDTSSEFVNPDVYYAVGNQCDLSGLYAGHTIYVRVYAVDRSGNTSIPTDSIEINVQELLSTVVAATYTAKENFELLRQHQFYDFDGTKIVISQNTNVSVSAVNSEFVLEEETWEQVPATGDVVIVAGFVHLQNNGAFSVLSATETTIKVDAVLVNEPAGALVNIDIRGEFDGVHIKAHTITAQALAIGSAARNFQLFGVEMNANTDNVRGKFSNTVGYLIMATSPAETPMQWSISAKTEQQALNKEYYVYVRCRKESPFTGEILFSEIVPNIEDSVYYNFLIGMYFTTKNPAILATSYGFTYINGAHVTTGKIDANLVEISGANNRVRLNSDGVWGYDALGNKRAGFGTDGTWQAGGGKVIADEAGLRMKDAENEVVIEFDAMQGSGRFKGSVAATEFILPVRSV